MDGTGGDSVAMDLEGADQNTNEEILELRVSAKSQGRQE